MQKVTYLSLVGKKRLSHMVQNDLYFIFNILETEQPLTTYRSTFPNY